MRLSSWSEALNYVISPISCLKCYGRMHGCTRLICHPLSYDVVHRAPRIYKEHLKKVLEIKVGGRKCECALFKSTANLSKRGIFPNLMIRKAYAESLCVYAYQKSMLCVLGSVAEWRLRLCAVSWPAYFVQARIAVSSMSVRFLVISTSYIAENNNHSMSVRLQYILQF